MEYIRCKNCSFVYDITQQFCPNCGAETVVSEDLDKEAVFNIND